MKSSLNNFLKHLGVFIAVETIFIILVFRELPHGSLLTLFGILHLSYRIIVVIAGRVRERLKLPWQKGIATFLPVVYHVFIHVYATAQAIEEHADHAHDEHELGWIIGSAVVIGILIFVGEYLLHRTVHCDSHHATAHQHCHDQDCESTH